MTDLEVISKAFKQTNLPYTLNDVFDATELSVTMDKEKNELELGWVIFEFDTKGKFRMISVY